jgi:hypothetical protein
MGRGISGAVEGFGTEVAARSISNMPLDRMTPMDGDAAVRISGPPLVKSVSHY